MKKIAVGAFPLIDIRPQQRKMIENYLINTLSDLINANQITASVNADRAKFITPMSIKIYLKNNAHLFTNPRNEIKQDDSLTNAKKNTITRAFRNTKNLYRAISNDPFYKHNIFYPIYIEEEISGKNGFKDYKYDFLIITNDLIQKQILDEIQFDDRITLLFLILKTVLIPKIRLSDLGKFQDIDMRKYFGVYLETCKNYNINPIDMLVRIIKIAGVQKRFGNTQKPTQKLLNLLTSFGISTEAASKLHSSNFLRLFDGDGEIKHASFLNTINQSNIADYLEDSLEVDQNYNQIARQYTQAKTHEYGKLLSIVDALREFNRAEKGIQDMNTHEFARKIEMQDSQGNKKEININTDQILNDIEVVYFKQFLTKFHDLDNSTVNKLYKDLDLNITNNQSQPKSLVEYDKEIQSAKLEIETIRKEQDKISKKMSLNRDINGNRIDDYLENDLNKQIREAQDHEQKKIQEYYNLIAKRDLVEREYDALQKTKYTVEKTKNYASIDLEEISAYLTGLYAQIYNYYNSDEFLQDIQTIGPRLMDLNDFKNLDIYKRIFKLDLMELANIVRQTYQIKFSDLNTETKNFTTFAGTFFNRTKTPHQAIQDLLNADPNTVLGVTGIETLFFENLIRPIFKLYSNFSLASANEIKDLRIEKNPLLRKLFSNSNLFKAYIVTDYILVQAYDILHYLDNLKYEVGLINSPVSKVFNKNNKIQFMITRLGLNDYPVFMINNSHVSLSMPSHLSMSNSNFISTISINEFKSIATLNFNTLWDAKNMFLDSTKTNENKKLKEQDLKKANDEIKNINNQLKNKKLKHHEKTKLNNDLRMQQSNQRKLQDELEDLNGRREYFSPNMANPFDKNQGNNQNQGNYPNDNQRNYPKHNQRDNQINHDPNEAYEEFEQGRDYLDGLQNTRGILNNRYVQDRLRYHN